MARNVERNEGRLSPSWRSSVRGGVRRIELVSFEAERRVRRRSESSPRLDADVAGEALAPAGRPPRSEG